MHILVSINAYLGEHSTCQNNKQQAINNISPSVVYNSWHDSARTLCARATGAGKARVLSLGHWQSPVSVEALYGLPGKF